MKKIVTIVGARPQFIKAAVLSRVLRQDTGIEEIIVHTGQHYDSNMSDVFFEEMSIPKPNINLGIGGGSHGQNTGQMIEAVEKILLDIKPDLTLLYGDTDSTLAGAIAASKIQIPIAHVEAGLRSWNKKMPEEINRILTDHCSKYLFTPTNTATNNLLNEGFTESKITQVGDVMYDAVKFYGKKADEKESVIEKLGLSTKSYALVTLHRKENTDIRERLRAIINALNLLDIDLILPLHPRTKSKLSQFDIDTGRIKVIDPVGYFEMIQLEKHSKLIFTDSGGVQKEAFFHNVPCVTMRDETEWVELVEAGWNKVVKPETLGSWINNSFDKYMSLERTWTPLYGNGEAGNLIKEKINE